MSESKRKRASPKKQKKSGPQGTASGGHGTPRFVRVGGIGGFADTTEVTLRYDTRISLTSSSSAASFQFRGNGPFDPGYTTGSVQPANWDTYAAYYQRYVCYGSKITIEGNNGASATVMPMFAFAPICSATVPLFDDLIAQPYAQYAWMKGSTGAHNRMSATMSTAKIFGLTEDQVNSDNQFHSQYSAVPTPFYWTLSQSSFDGATSNVGYYQVRIEYRIRFFDRFEQDLDLAQARRSESRKVFLAMCAAKPTPPAGVTLLWEPHRDKALAELKRFVEAKSLSVEAPETKGDSKSDAGGLLTASAGFGAQTTPVARMRELNLRNKSASFEDKLRYAVAHRLAIAAFDDSEPDFTPEEEALFKSMKGGKSVSLS